jgi:hypothetical protein
MSECFSLPESDEESTLEAMENIARQYEARIKRMIAEEKERGVTFPYINRDLQALANLRKAILKQKEWDSTHEDPHNQKRFESMQKTIDRRFKNMMDTLGEDGQERLLIRAANRFLELVDQHAVPVNQLEGGTFAFKNPEEEAMESN